MSKSTPLDPARVREIIWAFDEACRAVPEQPLSDSARAILAKRITELAQNDDWSAARLRDEALAYLKARHGDEA
jgi:N-acetylglucosamine kinase-like BadF-type ATPase